MNDKDKSLIKIISILGSPNPKGNTASILNEIERPFLEEGLKLSRYCLSEYNINYCMGCKLCYNDNNGCVQDDDAFLIMKELFTSDIVIVSSPSYWGDVTGQLKVFIDRCTPYGNTNKTIGATKSAKGVAFAVRAGQNKEENKKLVATIEHFLGHLSIPLLSSFTVEGVDSAEDLVNNPDILKRAYEFGKTLVTYL